MTEIKNLYSIVAQGLIPKNENNGKIIGEEKVKVDKICEVFGCDLTELIEYVPNKKL